MFSNKAKANYNMSFNKGTFKKGKIYNCENKENKIIVKTEENKDQEFFYSEFDMLFTFFKEREKNEKF